MDWNKLLEILTDNKGEDLMSQTVTAVLDTDTCVELDIVQSLDDGKIKFIPRFQE